MTLSENTLSVSNILNEQAEGPSTPTPTQQETQNYAEYNQAQKDDKLRRAKACGYSTWDEYKNSGWKCGENSATSFLNTPTAIKNFQSWYFTTKENLKPDQNGLYKTKLCSSPCTKGQALDGKFGTNTSKLWNQYSTEYKKFNKQFQLPINWTPESFEAEQQKKTILSKIPEDTKKYLTKTFRFTIQNPSGWNYVSPIPKAITNDISEKYAHVQSSQAQFYKGWDLLNNVFPFPKKYTPEELQKLFTATGGDKMYQEKLKEKTKADQQLKYSQDLKTQAANKSDRLGYDRYKVDGYFTQKQIDTRNHEEEWKQKLEPYKNLIYEGAKDWNNYLDKVNKELSQRCSRPLKFCDNQKDYNCVYISYSDICRNSGGIWVYNAGENSAWCGCRSMNDPGISNISSTNGDMFEFNGPYGKFTSVIAFGHSLPYQTKGTGGMDTKKREDEHSTIANLELVLTAAGFFGGPLAPLFFGAAAIVGLVDGVKYYTEGDKHMGVMMMSLSLLGAAEVAAAFRLVKNGPKAAKVINELGEEGTKKLVKDYMSKTYKLSGTEMASIQALKESTYHAQKILGREMSEKLLKNFTQNISRTAKQQKWGWKEFAKIFYNFEAHSPTFKSIVIYIAGVPYSIDQIYLALYGNDTDRQRSGIATLFDYLNNNPAEKEKALNEAWLQFQAKLVVEPAINEAFESMFKKMGKIIGGDDLPIENLMTDDEAYQKALKAGQINSGFDQARYDKIVTDQEKYQNELKDKEGCTKLNGLTKLGWQEINAIEYVKKIQSGANQELLDKVVCGGKNRFLFNKDKFDKSEVERLNKIYPKTMTGQVPVLKNMMDNPNS
jgi:hypothetical protein